MQINLKKYLPSFVYGGSDGAVSYFTLMAGAYGAGMPINMLIAIGISNVIADAFSMASADYLSEDSKSTNIKHHINITDDIQDNKTQYKSILPNLNLSEEFKNAIVTFFSFIALGLFPLAPTIYAYWTLPSDNTLPGYIFLLSCIFTFFGFTYIGYLRGKVLKRDLLHTILQSIIVCSVSAFVAYFIGEYVANILNI